MKLRILFILVLMLLFIGGAKAEKTVFDYPIDNVFVVPQGYDTNDNVEVTIHTQLPNACFKPLPFALEKKEQNKFYLNFKVKRKELSVCKDFLPSSFSSPIYYTKTLSLGQLSQGKYQLFYDNDSQKVQKSFFIKNANRDEIDDILYAPVTHVFIQDLIYTTADANVILTGILASNCVRFVSDEFEVNRQGDIFVITTKLEKKPGEVCRENLRPLQGFVSLGPIKNAGTYLVHVRSQSGLSVNKVFKVIEKKLDQRGF